MVNRIVKIRLTSSDKDAMEVLLREMWDKGLIAEVPKINPSARDKYAGSFIVYVDAVVWLDTE